jgi:hypothetical protein
VFRKRNFLKLLGVGIIHSAIGLVSGKKELSMRNFSILGCKLAIVVSTLLSTGCASIVSKSQYPVTINSNPAGATVTVKNKSGAEIQKATTPTTVTLNASSGYFSGERYSFYFEKEGYYPSTSQVSAGLDGWYVGNILLGGLIGGLIVDPVTGAMWKLDNTVHGSLADDPGYIRRDNSISSEQEKSTIQRSGGGSMEEIGSQLKQLQDLHSSGVLNDSEYEQMRKALVEKLKQ